MIKILTAISLVFTVATVSAKNRTILLRVNNTYKLKSAITFQSAKKAMLELAKLDRNRKNSLSPIYLVINSPGGSVVAGEALIQFAKTIHNLKTITMYAASMAHAVVQALPGARLAVENNILMAHRAKGTFSGQFETGEVESSIKLWKGIIRSMEQRNANRIGIALKEYKKKVKDEWWTAGYGSLENNIVDEIVDIKCSHKLISKKLTRTSKSIFGPITVSESACPLID